MTSSTITYTWEIKEAVHFLDILAIDETHLFIAHSRGLLKAYQGKIVAQYYQNEYVELLCHISDSIYFVGLYGNGLVVWNEQTDQELFRVYERSVDSIKRVVSTNSYIILTKFEGVKLLTIEELATNRFSLHHLFEA
jgi:hypothetical protein